VGDDNGSRAPGLDGRSLRPHPRRPRPAPPRLIWYNQSIALVEPVISARIHARLRDEILAGAYAPGDALPSERRLSEELGAGRHAVREALKRLQQSGLVRISQGGATRVCDWRHEGGLDLLVELGATGDVPPELELGRAVLEMRASVGADAARLCAARASAVIRADLEAEAERLAAEDDLDARNAIYERFWAQIVDGADNLAYRLALNTLVAGQRVLALDAALVGDELADPPAVRALAAAIAAGDEAGAHERAREILGRSRAR